MLLSKWRKKWGSGHLGAALNKFLLEEVELTRKIELEGDDQLKQELLKALNSTRNKIVSVKFSLEENRNLLAVQQSEEFQAGNQ